MAVEMDFCLRSGYWRVALRVERDEWQAVAVGRCSAPRLLVHARVHYRSNLSGPARGRRVARPRPSTSFSDDQRRRQSHRLPRHWLVVQRMHAIDRHTMANVLGPAYGDGSPGAAVFLDSISRSRRRRAKAGIIIMRVV